MFSAGKHRAEPSSFVLQMVGWSLGASCAGCMVLCPSSCVCLAVGHRCSASTLLRCASVDVVPELGVSTHVRATQVCGDGEAVVVTHFKPLGKSCICRRRGRIV